MICHMATRRSLPSAEKQKSFLVFQFPDAGYLPKYHCTRARPAAPGLQSRPLHRGGDRPPGDEVDAERGSVSSQSWGAELRPEKAPSEGNSAPGPQAGEGGSFCLWFSCRASAPTRSQQEQSRSPPTRAQQPGEPFRGGGPTAKSGEQEASLQRGPGSARSRGSGAGDGKTKLEGDAQPFPLPPSPIPVQTPLQVLLTSPPVQGSEFLGAKPGRLSLGIRELGTPSSGEV